MTDAQPSAIDPTSHEAYASHAISFSPDFLRGNVIVLSGAAGGIGAATSWLLARLGAHVVLAGRKIEKLQPLADALKAKNLSCEIQITDVRDRASVDALFDHVWNTHKRLDLLIHSAGGQFPQAAIDFSLKGWNAVVDTNLNGAFHMMQSAARHWRDARSEGSIVNIVVSPRGLHHVAHTVAARAGVIAFSEAVAVEWAPLGIRVNCIAPGVIRTAGWAAYEPRVASRYPNANPLRRAGTPWDVAEACVYLGGKTGSFITGETLEITGGGHLWGEVWTTDKPQWFQEASRSLDDSASGESK
jgi:citronellol/citronellal dehydrogenase